MIFTISSGDIKRIFNAAAKIMTSKPLLPILDNVLIFEPEPGRYAIMAGSGDNSAVIDLPIRIKEGNFHELCIPAKTMLSVASALSERPIDVCVDDATYEVTLKYQGGSFTFMGSAPDEYPRQNDSAEVECSFSIPSSVLLPKLVVASRFVGDDTLRPYLSAVCMNVGNEGVVFAGTDSKMLCRIEYSPGAPFITSGSPSVLLVPANTIGALTSILPADDDITVSYNGKNILFESAGASVRVRDIEGRYPRIDVVIPKNNNYHVTFNVKELQNVVHLANLAAPTATGQIKLEAQAGGLYGKTFSIEAQDVDYSLNSVQEISPVPSVVQGGDTPDVVLPDGYKVGMRSSFLLKTLGCINTENVRLIMGDPNRAILVREDDPKSSLLLLVMPMMLN